METNNTLDYVKIERTIHLLSLRINERFTDSSLGKTSKDFYKFARESKANIALIDKPNYWIRGLTYACILLMLGLTVFLLVKMEFNLKNTLMEFVPVIDAARNNILFIGVATFFLYTLEKRWKRTRAIKYLNELRGFAHVVDMHQLTKDPQAILYPSNNTDNSPKRELTKFELQRYLDYCAEFLSLIGKLAALYSQSIPDEVVVQSSGGIERLCSTMANKIWQKLIILNRIDLETEKE